MLKTSVYIHKYYGVRKKHSNQRNFSPIVFFFCFLLLGGWTRYKIKHTFLKLFVTVTVAKWCTEFPVSLYL